MEDKPHKCFINFEIKDFYPSITKGHLLKAIEIGKQFTKFTNDEIDLLIHTCQTIVCYDNRIRTDRYNIEYRVARFDGTIAQWISFNATEDLPGHPLPCDMGNDVRLWSSCELH